MSTYLPEQLLSLWAKSKLTIEMAIGHILQRLLDHEERLRRLERLAGHPPDSASE